MATFTLFLAGDVMTGRGLDQAMPHPSIPALHEPSVDDARRYVDLAAAAHGPIPMPVTPEYPWGDALAVLDRIRPAARIVNLETSITTSEHWCRGKEIHYRMHPRNISCLTAAGITVACLANNHMLDWGREGMLETVATLEDAGIQTAGAGATLAEARKPAIVKVGEGGRVVAVAVGSPTSGIPPDWRATGDMPGLDVVDHLDAAAADAIAMRLGSVKKPGDVAIVSIHWGSNWGFDVPREQARFARRLIDGGVDLVHGHSSHHVRPIEVYRDRLILFGCGDFLDDYEGIGGHGRYRGDLGLMYFPVLESGTGRLVALSMVPMQSRRFSLRQATLDDTLWLGDTLTRISAEAGVSVEVSAEGMLALRW